MNETWLQDMKNEFLINNDYNVIIIDWNELSKNIIYPWAAFSTRYVGKKTARLLDSIAKAYDIDGRSIHLTGHSLGAQVMAHTANFFNYSLNRITGKNYFTLSYELHCRQCIFDVIFFFTKLSLHLCNFIWQVKTNSSSSFCGVAVTLFGSILPVIAQLSIVVSGVGKT